MKSWKTTLLGILKILVVLAAALMQPSEGISPQIMTWAGIAYAVLSGIQGALTRDNDVSSESAGAK